MRFCSSVSSQVTIEPRKYSLSSSLCSSKKFLRSFQRTSQVSTSQRYGRWYSGITNIFPFVVGSFKLNRPCMFFLLTFNSAITYFLYYSQLKVFIILRNLSIILVKAFRVLIRPRCFSFNAFCIISGCSFCK